MLKLSPPCARRRPARRLAAMAVVAALASATLAVQQAAALQGSAGWRDRLIGDFSAAVTAPGAPDGICLTLDLNGEVVYDHDGGAGLVPASQMKIATAAVALELLGPDATYTTEVAVRADALADVRAGVLKGDLYLLGGGDPTLSTPDYIGTLSRARSYTDVNELADKVMAALRSRGVTAVTGSVVGDESRYPEAERDYTGQYLSGERIWKASFASNNLAGPLSALMINDGYHPIRGSRRGHVRPSDPARSAASLFDDLLEARGLVIRSRPRSGQAPQAAARASLGRLESVPMSQIAARILTHSDNTTAEMVLKEIGHHTDGSARHQAVEGAHRILTGLLAEAAEGVRWVDGSGLSSLNQMTCRATARLLADAGPRSPLVQGLAVAGETGTLRTCGARARPGSAAALNQVLAKSGTLNDVDALAGVSVAANGDVVTFAMISNEPLAILNGACNSLRRSLIDAAANYTYGPPRQQRPDQPGTAFVDMSDSVFAPAVQELADAGVALACDAAGRRFCGSEPIPRHEVAWYLAALLELPVPPAAGEGFEDVASDDQHAEAIAALAYAGITRGCDAAGGRFCPDRPVSRAEAASFLTRAFALPAAPSTDRFDDVAPGSSHEAAIAALAHAGITRGCDVEGPRFCPDQPVTRAEFAALLSRALSR